MRPKPPVDTSWIQTTAAARPRTPNAVRAARWRNFLIAFAVVWIVLAAWALTWPRESLAFRVYDFANEWLMPAGMVLVGRWCYFAGRRDEEDLIGRRTST